MPNSEKVQNLKNLIRQCLANGVISANEEATILRSGKEAGLDLETTLRLVGEIEMEKGLGKRNYNLLRMKAYIREYIQNDGVIDENELFTLQEIANKLYISENQLHALIDQIIQQLAYKRNNKNEKDKRLHLADQFKNQNVKKIAKWAILIIFGTILILFPSKKPDQNIPMTNSMSNFLNKLPVKELSVYKYRFHVLTEAKHSIEGFLGTSIGASESKVLLEGCVDVECGIDISSLKYEEKNNTINIILPTPKVIGLPRILTEGDNALRNVGYIGKNWMDLEDKARRNIQYDAMDWPTQYGLDSLTKRRVQEVFALLINIAFPNKEVRIRFDDK